MARITCHRLTCLIVKDDGTHAVVHGIPTSHTGDADLEHLLNLLALLPPPQDHDFWFKLAELNCYHERLDEAAEQIVSNLRQGIVAVATNSTDDATKGDAAKDLASSCLTYFDGEDPGLWQLLDQTVEYPWTPRRAAGRRWASDVCATAWRLFVPREAAARRNGCTKQHHPLV